VSTKKEDAMEASTGPAPGGLATMPATWTGAPVWEGAGETLFEREALPHLRALSRAALRLARNLADAEDLVQETYLRAYRAFATYTPGTDIRGWLFTILYRVRTDGYRRAARRPRMVDERDPDLFAAKGRFDGASDARRDVARGLAHVPTVFREAVVLRDVHELSYDEVSRTLGVPVGTVMSRLHRGRALLRRALTSAPPVGRES
jgi:RNA polymerase sigma-70 factor (ECF subfamily)